MEQKAAGQKRGWIHTVWLVENPDHSQQHQWLTAVRPGDASELMWTSDATVALSFNTEKSARQFADLYATDFLPVLFTEHQI